ncbi:MAG: FAD:protein FMN transferase [Actinobacteria bacterium]|nr:FAD:protein FMN transferase [Actinomycetota bacterium]
MISHRFKAMGTTVTLYGPRSEDFAAAASITEATFETEEQRFSRFRPDSELSRVNRRAGRPTWISEGFAQVVQLALDASERTDGLFDPTVLHALEGAGYDRDLDEVLARSPFIRPALTPSPVATAVRDTVRLEGNSLLLAEGVGLDFGGIAKGWTADRAAEAASDMLGWAMVDAGGDMRLSPGAAGMVVAIEDPQVEEETLTQLTLDSGALATSSTLRRHWGRDLHHLIDPRHGVPSRTGVLQATAWGATCAEAEVNAKWALLAGRPVLDRIGALLLMEGGEIVTNLPCGVVPREESA